MLGATDSKGKTHMDKDTTYMKDELSFSGALLQDGIDHIVFLLFWNARWRRGWDVERHAWRNQSEDKLLSFVYTCARPHGVGFEDSVWTTSVHNVVYTQCVIYCNNSQKSQGANKQSILWGRFNECLPGEHGCERCPTATQCWGCIDPFMAIKKTKAMLVMCQNQNLIFEQ